MYRPAEADKLVASGSGRGDPACCQSVIPVLRGMQKTALWGAGEPRLVGGEQEGVRELCWWEAWVAPVSALGGMQRGGRWVQDWALRL